MSWIGLRDALGSRMFRPEGLDNTTRSTRSADGFMPRGTIMVGFVNQPANVRRNLLRYGSTDPWHSHLSLCIDPDGTVRVLMGQQELSMQYAMPTDLVRAEGQAILTFSWDGPTRRGQLSLRDAAGCETRMELKGPLPMSLRDADRIVTHPRKSQMGHGVQFVAIADTVEAVGPFATLPGAGLVETANGLRRIDELKAGTIVVTADGDLAQVRWIGKQTLPAAGFITPQTIRSPYYGAVDDLTLMPLQKIELIGSHVEYLFGSEHVFAAVGHVADGAEIVNARTPSVVPYFAVLLDTHAVMRVSGVLMPSLDPAPFLNDPSLMAHSILRGLPFELLPRVASLETPVLRQYEAATYAY